MSLPAAAFSEFDRLLPDAGPVGLAVSGGSDSTALMHLAAIWARDRGVLLHVTTVDHGLRQGTAAEAAQVATQAAKLGLPHVTLPARLQPGPNVQARARAARYALLADWALDAGLDAVLLGHTRDDQAETFLLRLARGSGLAGLSGMADRRETEGVAFLRPLLPFSRANLRGWLEDNQVGWSDDPTNDDPAHARVRARAALATLADLGIGADAIAATMTRLADADAVIEALVGARASMIVRQTDDGTLRLEPGIADEPGEVRHRILGAAFRWLNSGDYPPRAAEAQAACAAAFSGETRTLGGAVLLPDIGGGVRMFRELAACAPAVAADPDRRSLSWDGRWLVDGPFAADMTVGALGPDDWPVGAPKPRGGARRWLAATPAIRRGKTLIAAPCVLQQSPWRARLAPFAASFTAHPIAH